MYTEHVPYCLIVSGNFCHFPQTLFLAIFVKSRENNYCMDFVINNHVLPLVRCDKVVYNIWVSNDQRFLF